MKINLRMVLCLFLMLPVYCSASGSLLNLDIDFSNDGWRDIFKKAHGKPNCKVITGQNGNKCLEISTGMLKSCKFPYSTGVINVSFDARTTDITQGKRAYHVAWSAVHLYNQDGKDIGHKDIMNVGKATGWTHYELTVKGIRSGTESFVLTLGNAGRTGKLWVDNIKISIETPGDNLCGDPGFIGDFAVDHWNNSREGVDWDKLTLKSKDGKSEYVERIFPGKGKTLHIKNNATFKSNRFIYDGSPLVFGGWAKHHDRKAGKKAWAWANVQLVLFDKDDKKLGHFDMTPLGEANSPWTYYSKYIPANKFRRNTSYVELWARGFEGSTGDSWFDEIQLVKLPGAGVNRKKYDSKKALVNIDAGKPDKTAIRPVWNGTDISYASKINHHVVKQLLSKMRKNGVNNLRLREFLQGCRIYKGVKNGEPVLNFKQLDEVIDWAVKDRKFILTATIESTPNQIAKIKLKNNAHANRSVPEDFNLWGRIVQKLVQHWIDRYGIETVRQWTFECWNEPCAERYYQGTKSDFLKIFDQYLNAFEIVGKNNKCQLRTGSISGVNNSPFFKLIFEHLKKESKLNRINPVSMHAYSGFVNSFDSLRDGIVQMQKTMKSYKGLENADLIITEYNGSSMGHSGRDSHAAAAFNVKANRVYLDTGVLRGYFFSPVDYQFRNREKYFSGGSGMFTKNGIPKPSFNSAILLNKLRNGKRVPLQSSNEPIDGIAVIKDGSLGILLTSFDETHMSQAVTTDVALKINWPGIPANLKCMLFKVDENNANSYTKWLQLGKPDISPATDKLLLKANELKPVGFSDLKAVGNILELQLKMPSNAIYYLEFK